MTGDNQIIRKTLLEYLKGGSAHADFHAAMKDFPPDLYARKPEGTPHNAWQMLEHMRITLRDLLEFCTNPKYQALKWPEGYWPKKDAPASEKEWNESVAALEKHFKDFEKLAEAPETDLFAKIPWGDGQTIFREILLAGDHTSYHVGQLILLRRQLGAWKE